MRFDELIKAVQEDGCYATAAEADEVTRTVLAALGRQLVGDERVVLARLLPAEAAHEFAAQIPATRRLTGGEFVDELAARTGLDPVTARWNAGSVLGVLARTAGPDLVRNILAQLPEGYALLFGQAQLAPARAA
ncbi:DUF2267 domain-containing protein [Streptomyces zagrosensis]|uniref:Uncharacterized protein (DUF2267 family) n=1 Tax=Streptomyces zagrosensis TaxID=1042984 RepID=A0A7W9V3B3_9ACTN|nr:DUF2267 domain-containing protein [Streptomyces zagrosensis]MBB5939719.1 uncharacterized protein (DUF2267 family) [Streptomyces zagrosensis]